jgi:integrase/recombinase XerD
MAALSSSTALMPAEPVFSNAERLALAGFLAGYRGLTREAYELDLRQFASWCHLHHLQLFGARRPDIECFARDLEAKGRTRATVTRRLSTVAGFYRYAVEEELLDHSPAVMSAGRGWTTNHTPRPWTATSWAHCWSQPGSARPQSMH